MSRNFDDRSRKLARERFWEAHDKRSYTCPDCGRGREQIVGEFQVHHKSGNPHDNRLDQLVALCGFCHRLREDKKPSLKRIRAFRASERPAEQSDAREIIKAFISKRACLCSEGRGYPWTDPIDLWYDELNRFLSTATLKKHSIEQKELKIELIQALRAAPETELEYEDSGPVAQWAVVGPDVNGREFCDCLTGDDITYKSDRE